MLKAQKANVLSAKGLSFRLWLRANAQSAQESQANEGLVSSSQKGELMSIYDCKIFCDICTLRTLHINNYNNDNYNMPYLKCPKTVTYQCVWTSTSYINYLLQPIRQGIVTLQIQSIYMQHMHLHASANRRTTPLHTTSSD